MHDRRNGPGGGRNGLRCVGLIFRGSKISVRLGLGKLGTIGAPRLMVGVESDLARLGDVGAIAGYGQNTA